MLEEQEQLLDRVTIDWLKEEWLSIRSGPNSQLRPIAPNTAKAYRQVPPAIRPMMSMPLSSLGQEWMTWVVAAMNEHGLCTNSIKLRVDALTGMTRDMAGMRLTLDDGAVLEVPRRDISKRSLPYFGGRKKAERIAVADDVVRDLLRFALTQGAPGGVIAGMIFTGRRVEQMTSLEREQIFLLPPSSPVPAVIRWRADQTKTGDDNDVTYVPRELLYYWPSISGSGRMFECSTHLVDKRLALFSEAYGIEPKVCSHDLRRYFITKNHMRGKPLKLIADMVGQKSVATTASYIKRLPSAVLGAEVGAFAQEIQDLGKNDPTSPWGEEWWKA